MDEVHDAFPRGHVGVRVEAGAAWRDAPVRCHVRHLGDHEARSTDGAAAQVHEMPVVRDAVLSHVLTHGRDGDAVWDDELSQTERREHRRRGRGG